MSEELEQLTKSEDALLRAPLMRDKLDHLKCRIEQKVSTAVGEKNSEDELSYYNSSSEPDSSIE